MTSQDQNDPFAEAYGKASEGFKHGDDRRGRGRSIGVVSGLVLAGAVVLAVFALVGFVILLASGPIRLKFPEIALSSSPTPIYTPNPPSTPPPPPRATTVVPNIQFTSASPSVVLPNCTTLKWKVEPVQAVKEVTLNDGIEDKPVERAADSYPVCPPIMTTYVLKVTMQDSSYFERTVQVKVIPPTATPPPSVTKAPPPTSMPTATQTPPPIILLNYQIGQDRYNWDDSKYLYTKLAEGKPGVWEWHLFNKNPGDATPAADPSHYVRYKTSFPNLLNYMVTLGWVNVPRSDLAFAFDRDHGYGVLFTTMDGQQWRFQLAGETNPNNTPKDYVVWALSNDMSSKAALAWQPCNCTGDAKLNQQNTIEVRYVTDSSGAVSAFILVNNNPITATGPVPLDKSKPLQVGLVLFGVPAHADVTSVLVIVGK